MIEKNNKPRRMYTPIEMHITSPLTNVDEVMPVSRVNIPFEEDIEYAKRWVDINEK